MRLSRILGVAVVIAGLMLMAAPSGASASFSGANGKIVYTVAPYDGWPSSIWVANPDGSDPQPLTSGGAGQGDNAPAWSPGGTMIAFTRDTTASTSDAAADLYIIQANGSGLRRLTSNATDDDSPNWSPDGSRLTFASNRSGNYEIYTMRIDGTDLRRLTSSTASDIQPNWSPDGSKIVFTSNRSGDFELYTMNAATGSGIVRLTTSAGYDYEANWSPDGSKIAFTSNRSGDFDIYVSNANGSSATDLTSSLGVGYDGRPSWSPDGTMILFEGVNPYDLDVLLMDADGSGVGWIVGSADDDWNPDWQPVPAFPLVDARFSLFNLDIQWIFNAGITTGCSSERYCPDDLVTRGQMAAFLDRALHLPSTSTDFFTDDATSIFEPNINRLAAAGITTGCTPTTYCPLGLVTRGQMAAFLDRALHLPSTSTDFFTDDATSIFEPNINRLAAAGITTGCTPTTYCPLGLVTRGQLAAFLHRALAGSGLNMPQAPGPRGPAVRPTPHSLADDGSRLRDAFRMAGY